MKLREKVTRRTPRKLLSGEPAGPEGPAVTTRQIRKPALLWASWDPACRGSGFFGGGRTCSGGSVGAGPPASSTNLKTAAASSEPTIGPTR